MGLTYEQRQHIKQAWSDHRKARVRHQAREDEGEIRSTRLKTNKDWAADGLEEVEPGDPKSEIRCLECGKVTDRNRGVPRRHYPHCSKWKRRIRND